MKQQIQQLTAQIQYDKLPDIGRNPVKYKMHELMLSNEKLSKAFCTIVDHIYLLNAVDISISNVINLQLYKYLLKLQKELIYVQNNFTGIDYTNKLNIFTTKHRELMLTLCHCYLSKVNSSIKVDDDSNFVGRLEYN